MAGSIISGTVNTTEGGTVALLHDTKNQSLLADSFAKLNFFTPALAATACPTVATGTCDGAVMTLNYDDCSFGNSTATWNGSQLLTFTNGSCTNNILTSDVTFKRTFGADTTRTSSSGIVVTVDTTNNSGYLVSKSGGITVDSNGLDERTITINGVHITADKTFTTKAGTEKTVTVWDHTVSSAPLLVTKSSSNFIIEPSTAAITVQHNLAEYTATCVISEALTYISNCCHPTSGTWSCSLSGSKSGSETLSYGPSCGAATYTNSDGAVSNVTLTHCL